MTESEAKGFIQCKLKKKKKCDVFNKEDKHRNNECELCDYCYSQGNFGEQKEAFQMALQALEKQIPKKMVIKNDNGRPSRACGGCGCFVLPASRFCSKCGQKLDWSDKE